MNKHAERLKQERRIERLNAKEGETYEKAVHEGVERAIKILRPAAMYALMTEFGFGQIRLCRFLNRFEQMTAAIAEHKVSYEAICDDICERTGVEYIEKDYCWYFPKVKSEMKEDK